MKKFTLKAQINNIPEAVSLTQDYLKSLKLKNDAVLSALFSLEDVLNSLINHSSPSEDLNIKIFSYFGNISVRILSKGTAFGIDELKNQ